MDRSCFPSAFACVPDGLVSFTYELLDLTSLGSVRDFAQRLVSQARLLDLLINNAAVMAPKERQDGFELQPQTNYLAPFALTTQLIPLLRMAAAPRVTQVSSISHRDGKIDFEDLQWKTRKYNAMASYAQWKLADLIFAFELQRHSDANGWGLLSNAAHPGLAVTDLVANSRGQNDVMVRMMKFLGSLMRQSAEEGALPILYAATSPDARPGTYYGPRNRMERAARSRSQNRQSNRWTWRWQRGSGGFLRSLPRYYERRATTRAGRLRTRYTHSSLMPKLVNADDCEAHQPAGVQG